MSRFPQVIYESKVYKCLQGFEGYPILYGAGTEGDYNYLAIEMLGPSLEDLFNYCNRQFTLKTVLMIADQAVRKSIPSQYYSR